MNIEGVYEGYAHGMASAMVGMSSGADGGGADGVVAEGGGADLAKPAKRKLCDDVYLERVSNLKYRLVAGAHHVSCPSVLYGVYSIAYSITQSIVITVC